MVLNVGRKKVKNAVRTFFFPPKHKWSEVVFNPPVCWADNGWPPASPLAYNQKKWKKYKIIYIPYIFIFFGFFFFPAFGACWMRRLRKCIHQQFLVYAEKQNWFFLPLIFDPWCKQRHLASRPVPLEADGCLAFIFLKNYTRCWHRACLLKTARVIRDKGFFSSL